MQSVGNRPVGVLLGNPYLAGWRGSSDSWEVLTRPLIHNRGGHVIPSAVTLLTTGGRTI
jgi:hypothetical protein